MVTLRYGKDEIPFFGCVAALGFFDGVHLAHRSLIKHAGELAAERSLPLAVFTFPSECGKLKSKSPRLYSTDEKLSLLSECKADYVILADFSSVCDMTPNDFVTKTLITDLRAKATVVGYNFTYGKNKSGNSETLRESLAAAGVDCFIVEKETFSGFTLSTTYIRELLDKLKLREAAAALGKPYFLSGEVVRGNGMGKSLGIPTINTTLDPCRYNLPAGVYITATELEGELYLSLTNIGECPTFGRRELHAETEILDFNGDLYGKNLRIYFLEHLREEIEFPNEAELLKQINVDKEAAFRFGNEVSWQELGLK